MEDPDHTSAPVELSEEETAVMLGCFAGASPEEVAASTGLTARDVEAIVTRLARLGLIDGDTASLFPRDGEEAGRVPLGVEPAGMVQLGVADPPTADDGLVALLDAALEGLSPGGSAPSDRPPAVDAGDPVEPAEADAPEDAPETLEHRRRFERDLRPLPAEARAARAAKATGPEALAFCFDPDPQVIVALFDNPAATLDHARLAAFHHRTARGLEEIARRAAFTSDPQVHRRLVRNPGLGESMLRRLMGTKRLLDIHRTAQDRDVPERTRAAARALFRSRFVAAQAEERVEVVWATEGRILAAMVGLTLDSRTTSILCSRTYASIMLIQSLARFPATPPALIAHLLKQPLVKRQAHLKNQLLQHPNTPSEAKRRL